MAGGAGGAGMVNADEKSIRGNSEDTHKQEHDDNNRMPWSEYEHETREHGTRMPEATTDHLERGEDTTTTITESAENHNNQEIARLLSRINSSKLSPSPSPEPSLAPSSAPEPAPKPHHLGHRQRLKDRFLLNSESLANYEILELLLGYVIRGRDVKREAKDLAKAFPDLSLILQGEFAEIRGLGTEAEILMKVIKEFGDRIDRQKGRKIVYIRSAMDSYNYAKGFISFQKREIFIVLLMTNDNELLGHKIMNTGTADRVAIYPREVIAEAIKFGASRIVVVHNHLGGSPQPSPQDKKLTSKLNDACNVLEIFLVDHIIIAEGTYYSFREGGML